MAAISPFSAPEVFSKAPITEALLDIRCRPSEATTLERLESIQGEIIADFPKRRSRIEARTQHRVHSDEVDVASSSRVLGYQFLSADDRRISQARLDGFTFNLLRPYSDWESFRAEAWGHWQRYIRVAEPAEALRLALRFINRIEIPLPFEDFREFVRTAPEISPDLPQGLAGFLMQLSIPLEAFGCTAIVIETIDAPGPNSVPLILDIDVFVERPFAVGEQEEMLQTFEKLRGAKNSVFFATVTERAKELFR